jgi:hypothetical protein
VCVGGGGAQGGMGVVASPACMLKKALVSG